MADQVYTPIANVNFNDVWSPTQHNNLLANAAGTLTSGKNLFPDLVAGVPLDGTAAAAIEYVVSSGAGTYKPALPQMRFGASSISARVFNCVLNYSIGTPILKIAYRMSTSVAAKQVMWSAYVAAVSSTDASMSAKVFNTVNSVTDAANATADTQFMTSITLTNFDSGTFNDWACIYLLRDTTVASNHTGTCIVTAVNLQYG